MAELIDLDICSSPQGDVVKVTSNPRANLMFYLHCISNVLDLSEHPVEITKLRDYQNFHLLSDEEIDDLLILSVQFYPAILIDKCIILNDEKCGKYENRYVDLADAHMDYPVVESMTIGGVEYQVMRAMYFTVTFIEEYYYVPMCHFNARLDRLKTAAKRYKDTDTCCTIL
ncbi:uncharacterized protein LOC117321698 [Pecten maximus]|uniref:uncharacterized protein LOC117321698 n=1 Tax=Pecten maximus TaxID=6579 RepID=UPI0014581E71|nr:uncharacterized protein LOC117321698 [Pecten maximus]